MGASARSFPIDGRLQHPRKRGRRHLRVTRSNRVRLRWAHAFAVRPVRPFALRRRNRSVSRGQLPSDAGPQLHGERAIHMADSFQSARTARVGLAMSVAGLQKRRRIKLRMSSPFVLRCSVAPLLIRGLRSLRCLRSRNSARTIRLAERQIEPAAHLERFGRGVRHDARDAVKAKARRRRRRRTRRRTGRRIGSIRIAPSAARRRGTAPCRRSTPRRPAHPSASERGSFVLVLVQAHPAFVIVIVQDADVRIDSHSRRSGDVACNLPRGSRASEGPEAVESLRVVS